MRVRQLFTAIGTRLSQIDHAAATRTTRITLAAVAAHLLLIGFGPARALDRTQVLPVCLAIAAMSGIAAFSKSTRTRTLSSSLALYAAATFALVSSGGAAEHQLLLPIALLLTAASRDWTLVPLGIIWAAVDLIANAVVYPADLAPWAVVRCGALGAILWATWAGEAARNDLRQIARQLGLTLDAASEAIMTFDPDGTLVDMNPAAAALLEGRTDLAIGNGADRCPTLHKNRTGTRSTRCPLCEAHTNHEATRGLATLFDGEGNGISVDIHAAPLRDGELVLGIVAVVGDRTVAEEAVDLAAQVATTRAVTDALVEAVLPQTPKITDVDIAVSYRTARRDAPTGGDLYDVAELPDGKLFACVVDVVGKGPEATGAAVALVRTLRTLAGEGHPVHELVARADRLLNHKRREVAATVVICVADAHDNTASIATASHPPALRVAVDGTCEKIDTDGMAVGWPRSGSVSATVVDWNPGDTIVLYSDGLVDGEGDVSAGISSVVDSLGNCGGWPAGDLAARLDHRVGNQPDDDTTVLALRRLPAGLSAGSWYRTLHDVDAVAHARRALRAWATHLGADDEQNQTVELAGAELFANAWEHKAVFSARPPYATAARTGQENDTAVKLVVVNEATGPWPPEQVPDARSATGRGRLIVSAITNVDHQHGDGRHVAIATIPLHRSTPPTTTTAAHPATPTPTATAPDPDRSAPDGHETTPAATSTGVGAGTVDVRNRISTNLFTPPTRTDGAKLPAPKPDEWVTDPTTNHGPTPGQPAAGGGSGPDTEPAGAPPETGSHTGEARIRASRKRIFGGD